MPAAEAEGADAPESAPLGDGELDRIFSSFADAGLIALAVSGGPDSLALLAAVDRWRRRGDRPVVLVLTVDHRLRRGSRAEALAVVRIARTRGMRARVLTRSGPAPTGDVEGAARAARYRLLVEAAHAAGATAVLTAHHRDDLAESFLMRLKRGAGVFGLAAMRPSIAVGPITIARPLLGLSRGRLAATTRAAGLKPIHDPMNEDPRFDRVRARRLLPALEEQGLAPAALAAAGLRLTDAADAIEGAATALIGEAVTADDFAVAWLEPDAFAAAAREVRLRALARLLMAVGGDDYPPRHERLAGLSDAMAHAGGDRFKRTLAGTVVEARGGRFAFYREIGRTGLPKVAVRIGGAVVWDHRFSVAVGRGAPANLVVGPLGEGGRRTIEVRVRAPAAVVAALPALWRKGRIVAVPGIVPAESFVTTATSLLLPRLERPLLFPDLAAGL